MAMVRAWLERGVDGFRLDVFNTFYKHADFVANPPAGLRRQAWDRQRHVHDQNQPELVAFLARFRAEVDARPGRMTVGELFGGGAETAASFAADRHLIFDFVLLERPWSAAAFGAAIERGRAGLRARPLADGRAVQPRPPAACLAPRASARGRAPGRRREGRGGDPAHPPWHPVPVLRRGARAR